MSLSWEDLVIDAVDPVALGRWWAEALGWTVVDDRPAEFRICPKIATGPGIIFEMVDHLSSHQRLQLMLSGAADDVARLVDRGAIRPDETDAGPLVRLIDPDGNEFGVRVIPERSGG